MRQNAAIQRLRAAVIRGAAVNVEERRPITPKNVAGASVESKVSTPITTRDLREKRDERAGRELEVFEFRVALFPPVSRESGIGECSKSAHELMDKVDPL
jgi:hypothetical protein